MNIYFPLWIDSGLGPGLLAGAQALRDHLAPSMALRTLGEDVLGSATLAHDILGYAAIAARLAEARSHLAAAPPERLVVIGGGCGIEVVVLDALLARHADLKVLWFDAHGDLNSPASSPSKHFHGMPLRFLFEPGLDAGIRPGGPALDPAALRLVGVRSLDPPERAYIAARGIRLLDSARVQESVDGWDASPVYAHIDLDVLDPREYPNLKCPEGGGLAIAALAGLLDRLVASGRLVGLSLLENTATARAHLERLAPILDAARRLGHA